MTQIGSARLLGSAAPGLISHRREIGLRHFASARIFTAREIGSSGTSTKSSTVAVLRHATTNSRPTISSSLRPYGCGCALTSPRPNQLGSLRLDPGRGDHLAPLLVVVLDDLGVGRRRGADHVDADRRHALMEARIGDNR